MKKTPILVGTLIAVAAFLPLQSCIGSFALTHKVINWNNQVGSKFINELVFFAFWLIPVYEVTAVADLLVLNSVEFWSGNNPVEAYTKVIDTDQGEYIIASDEKGYEITIPNGEKVRLDYERETSTWSAVTSDGEIFPFMSMLDGNHVKMIMPNGGFTVVELSNDGLQAYETLSKNSILNFSL